MMRKIFSKNSLTVVVYAVISLIFVGLSCLFLLMDSQFNFYPIVITAISFFFGSLYLIMALKSITKKMELSESRAYNLAMVMGGNFLRFGVLILAVVANFLFIYFMPHQGEIDNWVYMLLLISGLPSFLNIALFFMRSKYVE